MQQSLQLARLEQQLQTLTDSLAQEKVRNERYQNLLRQKNRQLVHQAGQLSPLSADAHPATDKVDNETETQPAPKVSPVEPVVQTRSAPDQASGLDMPVEALWSLLLLAVAGAGGWGLRQWRRRTELREDELFSASMLVGEASEPVHPVLMLGYQADDDGQAAPHDTPMPDPQREDHGQVTTVPSTQAPATRITHQPAIEPIVEPLSDNHTTARREDDLQDQLQRLRQSLQTLNHNAQQLKTLNAELRAGIAEA
ncbi:MAG: hypothetical protein R3E95_18805 [Thiolinea sp.]